MKLSRTSIPDLAALQAFECAARHGNFTQAAAELNLTQSAVSRQMKSLENLLGILLFERIRKRVVLSPAGKALLPEVANLLNQTEDMVMKAMSTSDGKRSLTIATLPTFGSRWLVRRLPAFLKSNPGIAINMASRSEPFDLSKEEFDVVIHYGQPVWAHATCTYLCSEVIVPVAKPSLLATYPIEDAAAFDGASLLHLTTRPRLWADWFKTNGVDPGSPYHGHRFEQFSMIIEAAVQGLGFALLPQYLIEEELRTGRLEVAFNAPMSTENGYYIVTPDGKQGTADAKAFQQWLIEQVNSSNMASRQDSPSKLLRAR